MIGIVILYMVAADMSQVVQIRILIFSYFICGSLKVGWLGGLEGAKE